MGTWHSNSKDGTQGNVPTTYAIGPAHSILAAQGALGPLHIPAVCWEEAAALPHRDSALPAPARAEETCFFFFFSVVHTIVSLAAPIHGLSHYPPHLSMEPTLGPGVQVNRKGGWRFQGKGGLLRKDAVALSACCPTVCVHPRTHSARKFSELGEGGRTGHRPIHR